jgi:tetratricopeptide (TPR) repeat protein
VVGCEPQEIVKDKVPTPIQDLLRFGPVPLKKDDRIAIKNSIKIVSPLPNTVFPVGKDSKFQVEMIWPDERVQKPEPTWTLKKESGNPEPLGKGNTVQKKLPAGKYKAEVSVTLGDQKVSRDVAFQVMYQVQGRIAVDNVGLQSVELDVFDQTEGIVSRAKTGKDGRFTIDTPSEDTFKVVPKLQGYTFAPHEMDVYFAADTKPIEFKAVKGELKEIAILANVDSDESITTFCPSQEAFLRFVAETQFPIDSVTAYLIDPTAASATAESPAPVKNAPPRGADKLAPPPVSSGIKLKIAPAKMLENKKLYTVEMPSSAILGSRSSSYKIRVEIQDEKGGVIRAYAKSPLTLDRRGCISAAFENGKIAQEKEKTEEALSYYKQAEGLYRASADFAQFSSIMEDLLFHRAALNLNRATASHKQDEVQKLLSESLEDLNEAFRLRDKQNSKDCWVQALLLRGSVLLLKKNYQQANKDLDKAASCNAKIAALYELRARALLQEKPKENVLAAVSELTSAINLNPNIEGLRLFRRELTQIAQKTQDEHYLVDTSSLSFRNINEILNLSSPSKMGVE